MYHGNSSNLNRRRDYNAEQTYYLRRDYRADLYSFVSSTRVQHTAEAEWLYRQDLREARSNRSKFVWRLPRL